MTPAPTAPARSGPVLTQAAFLAASWTWCIGMFLPVLLIRDFGWPGYLAFALPNVIGAAAMGWTLARPGASERMVARHAPAMRWFSIATVAFQVFFAVVLLDMAALPPVHTLVGSLIFLLTAVAAAGKRGARTAILALLISLALAGYWLVGGKVIDPVSTAQAAGRQPLLPARDLLGLVPVCVLGFALCPYLDLTFHRARQSLDAAGARAAFSLGFGVFFFSMILFTALYAPLFLGRLSPAGAAGWGSVPARLVLVHILLQTGLTTGLHLRELAPLVWGWSRSSPTTRRRAGWLGAGILLAWSVAAWVSVRQPRAPGSMMPDAAAESVYRVFMGGYGLLFPAYVLFLIAPPNPTFARRATIQALALAVGLAAPMFYLGFVERRTLWLVPGVAVILLLWTVVAISRRLSARPG